MNDKKSIFEVKKFNFKIKNSLKYKFILGFILSCILCVLLGIIVNYANNKITTTDKLKQQSFTIIEKFSKDINTEFEYLKETTMSLLVNQSLIDILKKETTSNIEQVLLQSQFQKEIEPYLVLNHIWKNGSLKSVFLFKDLENYYYITNDAKETSVINTINESKKILKEAIEQGKNYIDLFQSPKDKNIFYNIQKCYDFKTQQYLGYLVLQIDTSSILQFDDMKKIFPNIKYVLKNENIEITSFENDLYKNNIYYKEDEEIINNIKYLIYEDKIKVFGLTLKSYVPYDDIFIQNNYNFYILGIFIITFILLVSLLYKILYSEMFEEFNSIFNKIKNSKYKDEFNEYKFEELEFILKQYNNVIVEKEILEQEINNGKYLIKESELKFLKAQIEPHFIFNILDTINWHAKLKNTETIFKVVEELSKFLRANLNMSEKEFITLKEELDYINFYISLQKTRFGERIDYNISLSDENILNYKIPKLCLQPFIENAIIHGIEAKIGGGVVKLQIWEDDNDIYFNIIDNGVGFEPDKVFEQANYNNNHKSIALSNIKRRLKMLYNDRYSLQIESNIGIGTKVFIVLPIKREDKDV